MITESKDHHLDCVEQSARGGRWIILGLVGVSALLIGAFTHLLVVSFQSQPECVPHSKSGDVVRSGNIAAKSSC